MIAWLRQWLGGRLGGRRAPAGPARVRCDEVAGFPACPEFATGELLTAAWGGPAHTHFRRGG